MKLLMHICCAPCSVACIQSLRAEGIEPTGYWFNPNIHPYTEYRARRDTLLAYAKTVGLALAVEDDYGLRPFTRAVARDIANRCMVCYAARMRATARYASENGFTHFTSTLFISPYQNHALLRLAAEDAAQAYGVQLLYRDFRPLFRAGQEQARALELYMQKYCGCVYSEEERYNKCLRSKLPKAIPEGGTADAPARQGTQAVQTHANVILDGAHTPAQSETEPAANPGQALNPALEQTLRETLRIAGLTFEAARAQEEANLQNRV